MGFNLNRAMSGAGSAIADAALLSLRETLEMARDKARQEWASSESALNREHQSNLSQRQLDATAEQGRLTREHQSSEGNLTRQHQASEGKATRQLQLQIAEAHEKAAGSRHQASMGVQMAQLNALKEQVTLVPQADGTIMKMTKDGQTKGLVTGLDGKPVVGPKDVGAVTKLIIETNNKYLSALEQDMKTAVTPEEKDSIRAKMEEVRNQSMALLGQKKPKPDGEGQGGSGVDWSRFLGPQPSQASASPGRPVRGVISRYLPEGQ
jgi:hypothetical protein